MTEEGAYFARGGLKHHAAFKNYGLLNLYFKTRDVGSNFFFNVKLYYVLFSKEMDTPKFFSLLTN